MRWSRWLVRAGLFIAFAASWSIAETPARWASHLYGTPGLPRTLQVLLTDVVGPRGVLAGAALYLFFDLRLWRARMPVAALALLALGLGLGLGGAPAASAAPRNVLLVVVDGLRADRLDPLVTPHLAALAERGTRFDRAYASGDWRALLGAAPAAFARAGYQTSIVHDVDVPDLGFQRATSASAPDAPRALAERALVDLEPRPFFVAAAFGMPASPGAPHYGRFTDPAYRGRFKYTRPAETDGLDADDLRQVRGLYDGAVSAVDTAIGALLEDLERRGLANDTIVVVVGARGDDLGQGRGPLGDASMHVPLVVVDPRRPPVRIAAPARDVDLAPTLGGLAGVEMPMPSPASPVGISTAGRTLLDDGPRLAFARDAGGRAVVRDDARALFYAPTRHGADWTLRAGADEAVETDSAPEVCARLRLALWDWLLSDPAVEVANGVVVPRRSLPKDIVFAMTEREDDRGTSFRELYANTTERAGAPIPWRMPPGLVTAEFSTAAAARDWLRASPVHPFFVVVHDDIVLESPDVVIVRAATRSQAHGRVPLALLGGGFSDRRITARARTIDVVPTLLEIAAREPIATRGRSLLPLVAGVAEPERPVLGIDRALLYGRFRYRAGALFDIVSDVAETHDRARLRPDIAKDMAARVVAAEADAPFADAPPSPVTPAHATVSLRFVLGGAARRVVGAIRVADASRVRSSAVPADAVRRQGDVFEVATMTDATLTLTIEPPAAAVMWDLYLDDRPWPPEVVFGGPYGVAAPVLARGITGDAAREAAKAREFPEIGAAELGLFVVRDFVRETWPGRSER